MECKYCKEEVKEGALVCPHCQKKIGYKRTSFQAGWIFGILAAVVVAIMSVDLGPAEFWGRVGMSFFLWTMIWWGLTAMWRSMK